MSEKIPTKEVGPCLNTNHDENLDTDFVIRNAKDISIASNLWLPFTVTTPTRLRPRTQSQTPLPPSVLTWWEGEQENSWPECKKICQLSSNLETCSAELWAVIGRTKKTKMMTNMNQLLVCAKQENYHLRKHNNEVAKQIAKSRSAIKPNAPAIGLFVSGQFKLWITLERSWSSWCVHQKTH